VKKSGGLSDLHAWEAAMLVAARTRELLAHFPPRGYAELRDQMIRSSESIGHNIAEGRASAFEREYIKYLDTAARSANELVSQITDAMNYGIVPKWRAFNLNGTVICARRLIESVRDTAQANYDGKRQRRRAARATPGKPSPKRAPRRKL
jgi:four helix bundle protein